MTERMKKVTYRGKFWLNLVIALLWTAVAVIRIIQGTNWVVPAFSFAASAVFLAIALYYLAKSRK